jgi:uracil-DNA glycosylase
LPDDWAVALQDEFTSRSWRQLVDRLTDEQERGGGHQAFFPPPELVFNALMQTRLSDVQVVILGQDPYHQPGYAHGLAFSVPEGSPVPASLRNIFRELSVDLGTVMRSCGDLTDWARQGVLLLNTVLTVRPGAAGSHRGWGWETFTDAVIRTVVERREGAVFLLWGTAAAEKAALITGDHDLLLAPHPSPLSAYRGFFGSRPFSRANDLLIERGRGTIDWQGRPRAPSLW